MYHCELFKRRKLSERVKKSRKTQETDSDMDKPLLKSDGSFAMHVKYIVPFSINIMF